MKLRVFSFFIYLLFSINVYAYDFVRDGIFYTVISQEDATCEVASAYDNDYPESTYSGYVIIPETVYDYSQAEYTVVGVGKWAFYNSQLEGISLPSTIIRIEESAFQSCKGIASLVIPEKIEYIGDNAFYGSDLAVKLFIPKNCKYIGSSAFANLNITELTIEPEFFTPSIKRVIRGGAFSYCKYLSYVNLNHLHDDFSGNPFVGCSNLNTIEGSGQYTDYPNYRNKGNLIINGCLYKFDESDNIRYLELICCPGGMNSYTSPNSYTGIENKKHVLTTLGSAAFAGCTKITFLDIPNTVKTINNYALFMPIGETSFSDPDYIYRKVNIPESVEEIGKDVFGWWGKNWDIYLYSTHITNIHSSSVPVDENKFGTIHIPNGTLSSFGTKAFKIIDDIVIKYKLLYILDDEVYKEIELRNGESITPEPAPIKTGYTFSGWSSIPETMPDHDVTVTGSFTINKYNLIYQVDGVNYKSYSIKYGAAITPETIPTKEGYTFSGWSEIPESMPAHDVTVTGTFTINKYKLIYLVDNEVYKTYEVEYGSTITPEESPSKEGYLFLGWSDIPEEMPAQDVTVIGTFIQKGDVNGDKSVDMKDIDEIVDYIMGEPSELFIELASDINDDNEVNAADIVKLIEMISSQGLGIESQLYFDNIDGHLVVSSLSCTLNNERNEAIQLTKIELYCNGVLVSYKNYSGNSSSVAAGGSKSCSFDNLARFSSSTGFSISWHYNANGESFVYRYPLTE